MARVPEGPDEALGPLRSMAFHWREAEVALGLVPGSAEQAGLFRALRIEGGDLRKRPWGWSRGMQQRFVIAMPLSARPEPLVPDEPASARAPVWAGCPRNNFCPVRLTRLPLSCATRSHPSFWASQWQTGTCCCPQVSL